YVKRQIYYTIKRLESKFDNTDTDILIDELIGDIDKIELGLKDDEIKDPFDFAVDQFDKFTDRLNNPDAMMGVPYSVTDDMGRVRGLPSLDETFNGAQGGDLIMI